VRRLSDIDNLRRDHPLPSVVQSYGVKLEINGQEFLGCCPFHSETTPSFSLFRGKSDGVWRFHCFGCEARGDVVDFVQAIKGVNTRAAIDILGGASAGPNIAPISIEAVDNYAGITPLSPPEKLIAVGDRLTVYNPKRERSGTLVPSMVFPYRKIDGTVIGYVLRQNLPDGKKETPSIHWALLPNGQEGWCRYPFTKPRPLYGLDRIGTTKQVTIVEGEKCADRLGKARGFPVLSWVGGINGVIHTDWTPLRDLSVVIWPDNDRPGGLAAETIRSELVGIASRVRIFDVFRGARIA
jgi:hypothetical protein